MPKKFKLYFVVWFKISWQINCANSGLSVLKFLKYSSLILLRLIDWFPNLVILLLMHVKFEPDMGGLTRYMKGSVVTKTDIIIANAQKSFICITCNNPLICHMEKITGTLARNFLLVFALTQLRIYFFERRLTGPSNFKFCWSSVHACVILIDNKLWKSKAGGMSEWLVRRFFV